MDEEDNTIMSSAAEQVVELGNRLLEADDDADSWDVADGLLAGAIQFWLYSRSLATILAVRTALRSARRNCACAS